MLQKNSSCFSVRLRLKRVAGLATPVAATLADICQTTEEGEMSRQQGASQGKKSNTLSSPGPVVADPNSCQEETPPQQFSFDVRRRVLRLPFLLHGSGKQMSLCLKETEKRPTATARFSPPSVSVRR